MRRLLVVPLAVLGIGASAYVPWEDLTEADRLYAVATRFAEIDGRRVHYPTPTLELAEALASLPESAAQRHLAEARRELGSLPGALQALERWAEAEGALAWAEAARWGAAHGELAFAFRAASRARPELAAEDKRRLLDDEVRWADAHPEVADPLVVRRVRAEAFPDDARAVEEWIRALEKAGRVAEAETALAQASALSSERRLLLRTDLLADHGQERRAFELLDAALDEPGSPELRQAFARRADRAAPAAPESWRIALTRAYDGRALLRLATYLQGQGRGDAASALLQQVSRRYEAGFDRAAWKLMARLHDEIDAVPEAFRASLAASAGAAAAEQADDLAVLADLALRAGARPLAWGSYNDEPYRWVARIDRTPGFWTGGVSFLLTGQDWKAALQQLEAESLPDRTFATARALLDELVRRAPLHSKVPALRVAVMARHVERGEGKEALALLPLLQDGPVADEALRVALLAMRQVDVPLADELALWQKRLRSLAPDGSRPSLEEPPRSFEPVEDEARPWRRLSSAPARDRYREALDEATSRLDGRDRSHRAALELVLGEMDRLPDAEPLWEYLASRLESWNLDDDLGPRYEKALRHFSGEGWWARAARWYARRKRARDLERLADELVARFRAAAIFARAVDDPTLRLAVESQPRAGGRVRLVLWADWVRLRALERFPHSPAVFAQARARLLRRRDWDANAAQRDRESPQRVVVEDALWAERSAALLFADPHRREEYFAEAMRERSLERRLADWEGAFERTPVHDLLIMEGWARLSRFERAAEPGLRLAAAYPGDGERAGQTLSLLRSLAALEPGRAAPAAALVARTAPALLDPGPLWVELGEMQEEGGRPDAAREAWQHLLDREPRSRERNLELATVLWDYGHSREALAVIEEARKRLARPNLLSFEAGVLREEGRDVDGAVREYLAAGTPEGDECLCSSFESDQRALRRLAQLLGRDRPRRDVEQRLAGLVPGLAADEHALVSLLPLAGIVMPDASFDWTADDWIDALDLPVDPKGREARAAARADWRPRARAGLEQVAQALRAKALEMIPRATEVAFLDALEPWRRSLLAGAPEAEVDWQDRLLARRAELAPTPEERVARDVERARFLLEHQRTAQADAVWTALGPRVDALPEGAPRLRAEAERAAYVERARGVEAAAREWARLGAKYPWSLGLLEDRLAFLLRTGRGAEERQVLEGVIPRAGDGHRETLLERLTREALEAGDVMTARRAVSKLLAEPRLDSPHRLAALHLIGRLSFRENPSWDALAFAASQEVHDPERRADLYAGLARAAHEEKQDKTATALWIEALNRRLERAWLREAAFAADRAGEGASLRGFFERQRERSPRDVRWVVAVRELRLQAGDTDGALQAARAAIAVRPDRESLWREAADLLVRLGRTAEAERLVADWQKPRPADEGAAQWRADLLARLGSGPEAAAVERAALDAYAKEGPLDEDRTRELGYRRGRAARRLLDRGFPGEAWGLVAPGGDLSGVAEAGLGDAGTAELALAGNHFLRYLRVREADADYWNAAARVLAEHGRPEQKDETLAFLVRSLSAPGLSRDAFAHHWSFAREAEMEGALRRALARRAIAAAQGPWQGVAPAAFEESVGEQVVATGEGGEPTGLQTVRLPPLWVSDLVRRDDAEGLYAFLEPRWSSLLAQVRSAAPVSRNTTRHNWAAWLDDKAAIALWARAASTRAERRAELGAVFSERRLWDRLWALAARDAWDRVPLVALLPDEARTAWLALWQSPSPRDALPALRARGEMLERVGVILGRLVAGAPGSEADPLLVKLRGPRAIGELLGRDARWTWPEFEDGRAPGELWGERAGHAWYVLETLLRFRERDPLSALVPLEAPGRGGKGERARLAASLAQELGDDELALSLAPDLAPRLRLLVKTGQRDEARALFRQEVLREQPRLSESGYRALARVASDLDLPDPAELFDPRTPVAGTLLAYLCDSRGVAIARRLTPKDVVDFRAALAGRWLPRPRPLSAEEVRFYLSELWVPDAMPLPTRGLRALGGIWPGAAPWLRRLRPEDRSAGLEALTLLPDATKLEALLDREKKPEDDVVRALRLRVALLLGEDARARALLDEALRDLDRGGLAYAPAPLPEPGDEESGEAEAAAPVSDASVARLRALLSPFREAKRIELAAGPLRQALRPRLEPGPAGAETWSFALELAAPGDERTAQLRELERAFLRGDLRPEELPRVVDAVSRLVPPEAPRWLLRLPPAFTFDAVAARAGALRRSGDRAGAARELVRARGRAFWSAAEDLQAFDLWRELAPATGPKDDAPAGWTAARAFWSMGASDVGANLASHLRAHPFEVRAARAALRTPAPAEEDMTRLAAAALRESARFVGSESFGDEAILRLRAARGSLPRSAAAARTALETVDPRWLSGELQRRRFPDADVRAALADVVRIEREGGRPAEAAFAALEDLDPSAARALRAEHSEAPRDPVLYRVEGGLALPWRPRDLSWPVLADARAEKESRQ